MLLIRLALRNLWLHKAKTLIVGSILLFGTVLVIVGTGLLDAVDEGMRKSLVHSVAAHIQLYGADGRDEFQLFGNMDGSMPDSGRIEEFPKVKRIIESLDNVETVVPMGIEFAVTMTHSILERKLGELREAVRAGQKGRIVALRKHVRRIIGVLAKELDNAKELISGSEALGVYGDYRSGLARAQTDAFWQRFDEDPLDALEFLDNEVGPAALGEDMIWVRYLGTDTELFQQTFDRFEIVDGTMIPPGQRGFLFNKRVYEEMVKNKTARRLDRIKERLDEGQTIARCDDCATWIRHNVNQAASLVYQLDDEAAAKVGASLRRHLGSTETDLVQLLQAFMRTDDDNFEGRYKAFYEHVAPHIVLYSVGIGDEFVLTAYARGGGYVRKVPVKVYGTFRFRSLDRSPLAGGFNLMDIITFRDLYGYMTHERRREQDSIRSAVGVRDVSREQAEALFDDEEPLVEAGESATFEASAALDQQQGGQRYTAEIHRKVYGKRELWDGVVLNAGVMLKDGSRLDETLAAIRAANQEHGLGLEAVDWRKASGTVGQLVSVVRAVLYSAVFVIFIVALIIINNSLQMSTMERTREIGTMRAIGAPRRFVMWMFLAETGVLAVAFALVGALSGAVLMAVLRAVGIPASSDFFYFLFAGPRLYPVLKPEHIVLALTMIVFVALISTFHPALLATRITPREAMATED